MTSEYMTKQGDTFDLIAKYIYGDEKFFTNLIQENYKHRDTVVFSSGVKLKVPDIDTTQQAKTNIPWRD